MPELKDWVSVYNKTLSVVSIIPRRTRGAQKNVRVVSVYCSVLITARFCKLGHTSLDVNWRAKLIEGERLPMRFCNRVHMAVNVATRQTSNNLRLIFF